MMFIEMRDNAYDAAFELLEEAKHSAKKTKLTLCELEDAMYDCYEASKEDNAEYEDSELEFRGRGGYRHNDDYDMREDEDDRMDLRYRRGMRTRSGLSSRRNRMGRFV
jgi:hypothetical protein